MNNHLPISKEMEAVMQKHLSEKYSEEEADERWKKIISQYESFLKDLPDFGGKKSRHNGPGGTYDCIALFAFYEALDHEPGMDELYEMNCEVFLPDFRKMAGIVNANILQQRLPGNAVHQCCINPQTYLRQQRCLRLLDRGRPIDRSEGTSEKDRC